MQTAPHSVQNDSHYQLSFAIKTNHIDFGLGILDFGLEQVQKLSLSLMSFAPGQFLKS